MDRQFWSTITFVNTFLKILDLAHLAYQDDRNIIIDPNKLTSVREG